MNSILLLVFALSASCIAVPTNTGDVNAPVASVAVEQQPTVAEDSVVPQVAAVSNSDLNAQEPKPVDEANNRGARSFGDNDVPGGQFEDNLLRKLNNKCTQRDASSCAMLKLVTYMNRLLKKANIDVADNVQITTSSSFVSIQAPELPRSLSNEPEEIQLAELMTGKLMQFVRSRSLRLHLLPTTDVVVTSSPDSDGNLNLGMSVENVPATEGRGKNKNMGGLIAAIVMKMGMMGALAFKGLALLVGKALLVSKIALLLAVVLGLKKLFSQQKHVTYEVVAQPHHSHSHVEHVEHGHSSGGGGGGHDSYSSGWSRSLGVAPVGRGDGQDLAYGSYAPK